MPLRGQTKGKPDILFLKNSTDHSMDGYYYPLVSFNLKKTLPNLTFR
jgi:hypothetical protein